MADNVIIREAQREDCPAIIKLSVEIADFHKHFNSPQLDPKELERDTFDVENPNMGFYVAVLNNEVVGYAHYYFTYTVRIGKNMCLQDLFVTEKCRNLQIGDKLMNAVSKKAIETGCSKMEFVVTSWNPAVNFYMKRGAYNMTTSEDFHAFRFDKPEIEKMANR